MTDHLSNGEKLVEISDVDLCVETFGNPRNPTVLLVDGAAASMLWWEAELCEQIARGDRFVIRYDNRDTGRSTSYPPGRPGYTYTDLADETAMRALAERDVARTRNIASTLANHSAMTFDGRSAALATSRHRPWWCTGTATRLFRSHTGRHCARRFPARGC